jgi:hypothetical protein
MLPTVQRPVLMPIPIAIGVHHDLATNTVVAHHASTMLHDLLKDQLQNHLNAFHFV